MKKYISGKHSKYNLCYHIIFCPKYRAPILAKYEEFIKKYLIEKSVMFDCIIENIEIMPDHVHIFLKCKCTNISISKIIQQLKGYSSFKIRNTFTYLKKYKSFWAPSYYVESIGNISSDTIKKYINNQKINVKASYKYKKYIKTSDI